jgi:hypothetical protein
MKKDLRKKIERYLLHKYSPKEKPREALRRLIMNDEATYREIAGELRVCLYSIWEYAHKYCKINKPPSEMPDRFLGLHYRLLSIGDPQQVLEDMHKRMGAWKRVAKAMKVSPGLLREYRRSTYGDRKNGKNGRKKHAVSDMQRIDDTGSQPE